MIIQIEIMKINFLTKDELTIYLAGKMVELKNRRLEDLDIKNAPAAEVEYSLPDYDGLSVRVRPNGVKAFVYRYHLETWKRGVSKRYTYGNYPGLSLKDARKRHAECVRMVEAGRDISQREQDEIKAKREEPTVEDAFQEYKERYLLKELKAPEKQVAYFDKDIAPAIGKQKITEITRRQLITVLDKIVDRGAPIQANRTLSCLK